MGLLILEAIGPWKTSVKCFVGTRPGTHHCARIEGSGVSVMML